MRPRKGMTLSNASASWVTKKDSFWFGLVALCTVECACVLAFIGR